MWEHAAVAAQHVSRHEFRITGAQVVVGLVAAALVLGCVLLVYEVLSWTVRALPRIDLRRRPRIVVLILVTLATHTLAVWVFGLAYWVLDRWPSLGHLPGPFREGALDFVYFSVVTYTTLGFGDIVPTGPVRILTGAEALLGLTLITWSASLAFLEMQRDWREFRRPGRPAAPAEPVAGPEPPRTDEAALEQAFENDPLDEDDDTGDSDQERRR